MPTYRTIVIEPQERRFRNSRTRELRIEWTERKVFFVCQNCAHASDMNRPWDFNCRCDCHSPEFASIWTCSACGFSVDNSAQFDMHIKSECDYQRIICPYCEDVIYGIRANIDSGLRKHLDYCEKRPEEDDAE